MQQSGKTIIIPNESLLTNNVINWSYLDKKVKVNILFKISESSDVMKAKSLILKAAKEHQDEIDRIIEEEIAKLI